MDQHKESNDTGEGTVTPHSPNQEQPQPEGTRVASSADNAGNNDALTARNMGTGEPGDLATYRSRGTTHAEATNSKVVPNSSPKHATRWRQMAGLRKKEDASSTKRASAIGRHGLNRRKKDSLQTSTNQRSFPSDRPRVHPVKAGLRRYFATKNQETNSPTAAAIGSTNTGPPILRGLRKNREAAITALQSTRSASPGTPILRGLRKNRDAAITALQRSNRSDQPPDSSRTAAGQLSLRHLGTNREEEKEESESVHHSNSAPSDDDDRNEVEIVLVPQPDTLGTTQDDPTSHTSDNGNTATSGSVQQTTPERNLAVPPPLVEALEVDDEELAVAQRVDPEELERKAVRLQNAKECRRYGMGCIAMALVIIVISVIVSKMRDTEPVLAPAPIGSNETNKTLSPSPTFNPTAKPTEIIPDLPEYSREALLNPLSPQTKALEWLGEHPKLTELPEWKKRQLFALSTFFYPTKGEDWPLPIKNDWLDETKDECNWFSDQYIEGDKLGWNTLGDTYVGKSNASSICFESGPLEGRYEHFGLVRVAGLAGTIPPEVALVEALSCQKMSICCQLHPSDSNTDARVD